MCWFDVKLVPVTHITKLRIVMQFMLSDSRSRQNVKKCEMSDVFRIQSSSFDGSDVRTLGSAGQRISHPFGLALYHGKPVLRCQPAIPNGC